jgi:hypothetical protein
MTVKNPIDRPIRGTALAEGYAGCARFALGRPFANAKLATSLAALTTAVGTNRG